MAGNGKTPQEIAVLMGQRGQDMRDGVTPERQSTNAGNPDGGNWSHLTPADLLIFGAVILRELADENDTLYATCVRPRPGCGWDWSIGPHQGTAPTRHAARAAIRCVAGVERSVTGKSYYYDINKFSDLPWLRLILNTLLTACEEAIEDGRRRGEDMDSGCWPALLSAVVSAKEDNRP
jgi:hypothetical protein